MMMLRSVTQLIIFFLSMLNMVTSDSYYRGNSNSLRIGLITDDKTEEMSTVFEYAIVAANEDLEIPLRSISADVNFGNSFEAYTTLCGMLINGVAGIFGPSSKNSALHLMNACDSKEIPYIYSHMDSDDIKSVINLYPNLKDIAKVIHDLIKVFGWKSYTILYESGEYLPIFDELKRYYKRNGPYITLRRYDLNLDGNYRNVLRRVRKSPDIYVVILGSIKTLPDLLYQAQQVGLITEQYEFIIGNLDLQTINLEEFKYSEANITSFRIVSPDNARVIELIAALHYPTDEIERNITCPISTEMALLYDAVQLFAETTKTVPFKSQSLDCTDKRILDSGYTFANYMALSHINGITGNIFFEGRTRTDYSLEIIELTASGLSKVGSWNSEGNLTFNRYSSPEILNNDELSLVNKTFTVLLALSPPYAMLKQSTDNLFGNDRYEGFGIELIQRLAEKLGFNFTFNIHENDNYGLYNTTTNISTGMVHEIMEGHADLGVTDLTITSEREAGVDFTIPFMNLGISILYRKPQKDEPNLFSFMDPFAKEVWICLGLAYFGISFSMYILGRISPMEWDNPYPCIEEPTELENQLSLGNCLWFATGCLLQQGSEIAPRALSTRVLASVLAVFTVIVVASYTANLAACLTIEVPTNLIEDVKDLAQRKGGVTYGSKSEGSTRNFFEFSEDKTYKLMNKYMNKHPEHLTSTNKEGVMKVLSENYAFLMESTSIEYNVARQCDLKQIGGLLDEKSYGIAMRKNWPYRDKLNDALLELQESGVLSKMKSKWWNEVGTAGCTSKKEDPVAPSMKMVNVGGVYFVLLVGSLIAAASGIIDWMIYIFRKSRRYKIPFFDVLVEEFRIVIDFSNNIKPGQSTNSIYSTKNSRSSRNASISFEGRDLESTSKN